MLQFCAVLVQHIVFEHNQWIYFPVAVGEPAVSNLLSQFYDYVFDNT